MNTPFKCVTRTTSIRKLHSDDRGLSTVEYVIILVLIAVAAITTWTHFGSTITGKIKGADSDITKMN
jgi:Flp pilus assembly pilin Flp